MLHEFQGLIERIDRGDADMGQVERAMELAWDLDERAYHLGCKPTAQDFLRAVFVRSRRRLEPDPLELQAAVSEWC